MTIGLSTYAYTWRMSAQHSAPYSVEDVLEDVASLGVSLLQICDVPGFDDWDDARLRKLSARAGRLGVRLQLGMRGTDPERLERYLGLAERLEADLLRTMIVADREAEAEAELGAAVQRAERSGVDIALETYEGVATARLIEIVQALGSERLGICLDPANTVARLEMPESVVRDCAPHVLNLHVKDFCFGREESWIGFRYAGCLLGEGLLELDRILAELQRAGREPDWVVEHWLPRQRDDADMVRTEAEWTQHSIDYLKRVEEGQSI